MAFLTKNKAKLCKILIITLVFDKNAYFCQKIVKFAENCDHNIDPRSVYKKQHFFDCAGRHDKLNFARLPSDLNLAVKNCSPNDKCLHKVRFNR
jgi:hypothetical protein